MPNVTVPFHLGDQRADVSLTIEAGGYDRVVSGTISGGFTVPAGERWFVDGFTSVNANVIVNGTLVLRPGSHLRFREVNESAFVGGGLVPIASDVGLWVMGDGVLDAQGTPKVGWNRTGNDPTWTETDDLRVTPTTPGRYVCSFHDRGDTPSQYHDLVPRAEVFNLTRDVIIEGTPGGRSHVFIHAHRPQHISYVTFRHMGPKKGDFSVMGRYPLHIHHGGDSTRGTTVLGCVVHNSGAHAFVAHASHGIAFRDCVAFDIEDSAYWWDPIKGTGSDENQSNDIVYDHCLAAEVRPALNDRGNLMNSWGAFHLVAGEGGVVQDCVAAAVTGPTDTAGFAWPPNDEQSWVFVHNVAHNITKNGIWIWQNANSFDHNISDFTAYLCEVGIDNGAYRNRYKFDRITLVGNVRAGMQLHVFTGSQQQAIWDDWLIVNSPRGIEVMSSNTENRSYPARVDLTTIGVGQPIVRSDNQPAEVRVILTNE